jgi:hypothetical protein
VYTLFDYGDFTSPNDTSSSTTDPPYIQLLSLTDPGEAHRDFVTVRLGGIDVPPRGLTPGGTNTNQDENRDSDSNPKSNKHVYAIIGSVVVIGVLLLIAGILVYRGRKNRNLR